MEENQHTEIAVVMTCFNRREKTLSCLRHLMEAEAAYNARNERHVHLVFYITDDGCTDGTAEAVLGLLQDREAHIIEGDGTLYWAGGMRAAWRKALEQDDRWHFYLLQNDDTDALPDALDQLMQTHAYSLRVYGRMGIYSGITASHDNPDEITYSGYVYSGSFSGDLPIARPAEVPQPVFCTNANILLVPAPVVRRVGIFYKGYRHGAADYDYTGMVRRRGFTALVTPGVCGLCDYDHPDTEAEARKILAMTCDERRAYFASPLHSPHDYLLYTLRNRPLRLPQRLLGRMMNMHCPRLYYKLHGISR